VDVLADPARLEEMLRMTEGRRRVPVLVQDGKVEVGWQGGS
jgi:glutaredoxin